MGPVGPQGLRGETGAAASIDVVRTITAEPGTEAHVYNGGTRDAADLTFIIPAGATGPTGATGPEGPAGTSGWVAAFGGFVNLEEVEFFLAAGETAALTFSDQLPSSGVQYLGNHSLLIDRAGVYDLSFALRGWSEAETSLRLSVSNNSIPVFGALTTQAVKAAREFALSSGILTSLAAGDQLMLLLSADRDTRIRLPEGNSVELVAKLIQAL
ncbi:MAG: hypothetical protein LBJ11_08130 [Oscillospiraceae bacterium]|jgi:hypothetical protein|nr:hypothetical protein [Oscillospiraceae bacterium]